MLWLFHIKDSPSRTKVKNKPFLLEPSLIIAFHHSNRNTTNTEVGDFSIGKVQNTGIGSEPASAIPTCAKAIKKYGAIYTRDSLDICEVAAEVACYTL